MSGSDMMAFSCIWGHLRATKRFRCSVFRGVRVLGYTLTQLPWRQRWNTFNFRAYLGYRVDPRRTRVI